VLVQKKWLLADRLCIALLSCQSLPEKVVPHPPEDPAFNSHWAIIIIIIFLMIIATFMYHTHSSKLKLEMLSSSQGCCHK